MMDGGEWFDDRMYELADDLTDMELVQLMSDDYVGRASKPAPSCLT